MARQSQSLREKARIANPVGDLILKQADNLKNRLAQSVLGAYGDRAKAAVSGDYKGEEIVEGLKFLSSFFGAPGKAISLGLTGVDYLADMFSRKKKLKDLGDIDVGKNNPYAKALKAQADMIRDQVIGTHKGQGKADFMNALIGGVTTGAGTKFGGEMFEKIGDPAQKVLANMGLGIPMGADKVNILDSLKKFLESKVPLPELSKSGLGVTKTPSVIKTGVASPSLITPITPSLAPSLPGQYGLQGPLPVLGGKVGGVGVSTPGISLAPASESQNFASKLLNKLNKLPEAISGPSAFDVYDYARPQIGRAFRRPTDVLTPELAKLRRQSISRRIV